MKHSLTATWQALGKVTDCDARWHRRAHGKPYDPAKRCPRCSCYWTTPRRSPLYAWRLWRFYRARRWSRP